MNKSFLLAALFAVTIPALAAGDEIHIFTAQTSDAERDNLRKRGKLVMLTRGVPIYPAKLLHHDPSGCVNIAYDVLPDGRTANPQVLKSAPPKMFDDVAIRSIEVTRFEPHPATTRTSQIVTFSIVPMPKGKPAEADLIRAKLQAGCL